MTCPGLFGIHPRVNQKDRFCASALFLLFACCRLKHRVLTSMFACLCHWIIRRSWRALNVPDDVSSKPRPCITLQETGRSTSFSTCGLSKPPKDCLWRRWVTMLRCLMPDFDGTTLQVFYDWNNVSDQQSTKTKAAADWLRLSPAVWQKLVRLPTTTLSDKLE